jgi:DNA-binding CsgD family transcriptional regulator
MSRLQHHMLIREITNALHLLRSAHRRSGIDTFQHAADMIAPHLEATTEVDDDLRREIAVARDQIYARLNPRERTFLHLDADGLSAEEISVQLGIRPSTVYRYRTDFKMRFFCETLGELQRYIRGKREEEGG